MRDVAIAAPRGEILDSSGHDPSPRASAPTRCEISPADLPVPITDQNLVAPAAAGRRAVRPRSRASSGCRPSASRARSTATVLLRISRRSRAAVEQGYVQLPYAEATVATDVTDQQLWYICRAPGRVPRRERPADLPAAATRSATIAAQVLGIVGRITAGLRSSSATSPACRQDDSVGQSGLEASVRPLPAGRRRRAEGARSTRSASFDGHPVPRRRRSPATTSSCRSTRQLQQVGQQALAAVDRRELPGATAARSWR